MEDSLSAVSQRIRHKAVALGFDLCGIARVRPLTEYEEILNHWCRSGMNGSMGYLGRDTAKRLDPAILFPGARSVIVTGLNYYTDKNQGSEDGPVISRYAYGENYHDVITAKLDRLLEFIKVEIPGSDGKCYVDSSPLLEKAWAHEAGLGWAGKHSVLINEDIGSFFLIGIILLNADLGFNSHITDDKCGSCRKCIESCPTSAINDNRTIDVRKCIAYHTIESREPIPSSVAEKMERRVFGCDRCQEVCPWNSKAKEHKTAEFKLNEDINRMAVDEWFGLTREQFDRLFAKSAIKRGKYERLTRNIAAAFNSTYPVK